MEIKNPMDYHVALYIRLSKEDENNGPSESVNNQRSLLNEFVKRHHLSIYDIYVDDGWSGTNFDRPGFQRMLADIEEKKVNMVITKDLSRLGRDYILTGHYMERYFPEKRVRYISLLDGIDTGVESSANDITPFRAIMNDMYAKDISKKIKSVKHDKQRKGLFIGGKPMYGYQMHPTEKNKIVVDEKAAPIVRRMFAMAVEGMSCRQIAMQLNREGIPSPASYAGLTVSHRGPYAGQWSSERIAAMLKNETYIGNMVQGCRAKISYKSKKCVRQTPNKWVIVKGTHEPLIDAGTFQKAQEMLESRRHTRSRTYDFLLKGLIFCHECGHPLAVLNRKNAAGEDRLIFVCRTYQRFTHAGVCTSHYIKEQAVNEAVAAKVSALCESSLDMLRLRDIAQSALEACSKVTSREDEIRLKNQSADLTARLDRVYMDRLNGLLDDGDFKRIYHRIKQERDEIEIALRAIEQRQKSATPAQDHAQMLAHQFAASICTSREALVSLIERVELTQDKHIILKFRFKAP